MSSSSSTADIELRIHSILDSKGIDEATKGMETLQNAADLYGQSMKDAGEQTPDMFAYAQQTFQNAASVMSQFSKFVSGLGVDFSRALFEPFEDISKIITTLTNSVGKAVAKNADGTFNDAKTLKNLSKVFGSNNLYDNLLSINEYSNMLSRMNTIMGKGKTFEETFGWSSKDFNKQMPLFSNRILQDKIRELHDVTFRDTGNKSARDYAVALYETPAVRDYMKKSLEKQGFKLSKAQILDNLELATIATNHNVRSRFGREALFSSPYESVRSHTGAYEIIPERFREAYFGRGYISQEKESSFMTDLSKKRNQKVDSKIYEDLINFVENSDEGTVLHEALKKSKIMQLRSGRRNWAKNLSVEQASFLSGLASQGLYDAKRGYAFYDADPTDPAKDKTLDRRLNRRVLAYNAALEILSKDSRVTPVIDSMLDTSTGNIKAEYAVYNPANRKQRMGHKSFVTGLPTANQIIVPKAQLNENGSLIFSDPNWQKTTGFNEHKETDQMVIATDSPIFELLKHVGWTSKSGRVFTGEGNGTFGYGRYGRNESDSLRGKAIYDTPPIITVGLSQFMTKDKKTGETVIDQTKLPILQRLVSEKNKYGDSTYEYLTQGTDSIQLIESGAKKLIKDWSEREGIPDLFEGFNPKKLEEYLDDPKGLIKQVASSKKSTSTGAKYEDIFGSFPRKFQTRIANMSAYFGALAKLNENDYGHYLESGQIPDGVSIGNAEFFRNGPLQMRSMVGYGKFVLNPYNLNEVFSRIFKESGAQDNIDKVTEDSYNGNWLISKGTNGKLQYWLPSISVGAEGTAKDEEERAVQNVYRLMTGQGSPEELRALRNKYFFQANDNNIGVIHTDKTVKSIDQLRHLRAATYMTKNGGEHGLALAAKEGRFSLGPGYDVSKMSVADIEKEIHEGKFDRDAFVTLNAKEQGETHDRMTPDWIVMRSAEDFANRKGIVSQQIVAGMGLDIVSQADSDEEFNRRVHRLQTARGRREALMANPSYKIKLQENPEFAYSQEAEQYIQNEIRLLRQDQMEGKFALKDSQKRYDRLAGFGVGGWIQPLLEGVGVRAKDVKSAALRAILPETLDANKQIITSPDIMSGDEETFITRSPGAPAEYDFVVNAFKDIGNMSKEERARWSDQSRLKKLDSIYERKIKEIESTNPDYANDEYYKKLVANREKYRKIGEQLQTYEEFKTLTGISDEQLKDIGYFTTKQMQRLNTGDFDGDVVTMLMGLEPTMIARAKRVQKEVDAAGYRLEKDQFRNVATGEVVDVDSVSDARIKAALLTYRSTQAMGAASKLIREAMALPDSNKNKWELVYEGKKAYDFASSDMRKKGQTFKFSDAAMNLISGQNLYQRFVKRLNSYGNMRFEDMSADEQLEETNSTIDALFKTGLPTINDAQGMLSRSILFDKFSHGELDMSYFNRNVQTLLDRKYGTSESGEAMAARWYAGMMSKTLTGRLVSERDIDKANQILQQWTLGRNKEGFNASTEDETDQYQRFKRLVATFRDTAPTRENVQKRRSQLMMQKAMNSSGFEEYGLDAELAMYDEALRNDEASAEILDKMGLSQYKEQKELDEIQKQEQLEIQKAVESNRAAFNDQKPYHKIRAMNWSNIKNWIKGIDKDANNDNLSTSSIDIRTIGSHGVSGSEAVLNFDSLKEREQVAIRELMGKEEQTASMTIGSIMHLALQRYFEAAADGELGNRSFDSFYEPILKEGSDYYKKLAEAGYIVKQINNPGEQLRYRIEGGGHDDRNREKLKNILPISKNDISNVGKMINSLQAEGFDVEHPNNVEGNIYTYDKNGKQTGIDESADRKIAIKMPVFNDKGNISGYTDTYTYARPDLMLRHSGGTSASGNKYDEGYYILDYKSSHMGAKESLQQSAFYAALYDSMAKAYWENMAKPENQRDSSAITLGRHFKDYGHIVNGKYESFIKGAIGLDPNNAESVFLSKDQSARNKEFWDTTYERALKAIESKSFDSMIFDATDLNNPYGRALYTISESEKAGKTASDVMAQARNRASEFYNDGNEKLGNDKTEYFLARYTKDLDDMEKVRSALNRESDEPEQKFNRFDMYRRKLNNLLSDEVAQATIEKYGWNSPQAQQIQKELEQKEMLLSKTNMEEYLASVKDFKKIDNSARAFFSGTKEQQSVGALDRFNDQLRAAEKTREGLLNRTITVNEQKKDAEGNVLIGQTEKVEKRFASEVDENGVSWRALTPLQQAELFLTKDDNDDIQNGARDLKDQFLKSVKEEEKAIDSIKSGFNNYLKGDKAKDDQDWASITGEIIDPSELLSQAFNQKREEIQRRIDTWNNAAKKLRDELKEGNVKSEMQPLYEQMAEEYERRAKRESEYIESNGRVEQSVLKEKEKQLGLTKETPAEQAQKWLNERLSVRKARLKADYDDTYSRYKEGNATYTELMQARDLANGFVQDPMVEYLKQQANQMQVRGERAKQDEYDSFIRGLTEEELTDKQQRGAAIRKARDRVMQNRDQEQIGSEAWNRWNDLLRDTQTWRDYNDRLKGNQEADTNAMDARMRYNDMASAYRLEQVQRQADLADKNFARQRAMSRNYSMFSRAYQPYVQRRESLKQQIESLSGENGLIRQAEGKRDIEFANLYKNKEISKALAGKSEEEAKKFLETYNPKGNSAKAALANYKNAQSEVDRLNATLASAQSSLSKTGGVGAAAFDAITMSVSRLAQRLGRQMFQKALAEAKKFVKEFNSTMTEIQMITLKTDDQMSNLGSNLIEKAKELKISVSEVTKSAATLYRQGLSDQEVSDRLDVVSKFSKVSGTKVEDATKLITVAMNTGLVSNAVEAADIVTALGDNAATNAAQIEKGIEKAGAAAAADGTTFGQLAAMLTSITSTTQIGGNVAGRTLSTIFSRMNKIGTNELIYDENGNAVSGSAVAKLLEAQGIRMYDENGNKRSSFDTLYALSQKWEGMSDAEQQQIANAIAGTRQYSNFAAIMQGMSEGEIDKYMDLIGESSGITDKKFDVYTKSLDASLTNLRNTFDALIADLTSSGALTGIIDQITAMIQGVDNLTGSLGNLSGILPTIIGLFGALQGMKIGSMLMPGSGIGAGVGALVGGLLLPTVFNSLVDVGKQKGPVEQYRETVDNIRTSNNDKVELIAKARKYQSKENLTEEDRKDYISTLNKLATFTNTDKTSQNFIDLSNSISNAGDAASKASQELNDYAKAITKEAEEKADQELLQGYANNVGQASSAAVKEAKDNMHKYNLEVHASNQFLEKYYGSRGADGKYHVDANSVASKLQGELASMPGNAIPFVRDVISSIPVSKWFGYDPEHDWASDSGRLAEMLWQANIGNPDYVNKGKDYWKDYVYDISIGKSRESVPLKNLEAYLNDLHETEESRGDVYYKQLETNFAKDLSVIKPDLSTDEIESLSKYAISLVQSYISSGKYEDYETAYAAAYNKILGFDGGEVSRAKTNAAIDESLIAAGYTPSLDKIAIRNAGYETVSAGGYYIGEDGLAYTEAEVSDRIKQYNDSINPLTAAKQYIDDKTAQHQYKEDNRVFKFKNAEGEDVIYIGEQNRENANKHQESIKSYDTYSLFRNGTLDQQGVYGDDIDSLIAEMNSDIFKYETIKGKTIFGTASDLAQRQEKDQLLIDIFNYAHERGGMYTSVYQALSGIKDQENMNLTDEEYNNLKTVFEDAKREDTEKGNSSLYAYGGAEDFEGRVREKFGYSYEGRDAQLVTPKYAEYTYEKDGRVGATEVEEIEAVTEDIPDIDTSMYNLLPKEIQELVDKVKQVGYASADELEQINNAIANVKALEQYQAINDYFLSGAATSAAAWSGDTKNSYAVLADNMLRLVQESGATDIKSLMDYVNITTKDKRWNQLYSNSEFGRIMSQVQRDEHGNITSAPENIMQQIIDFLYGAGREFGARELSATELGQRAYDAYDNYMQNGFFISQDARDEARSKAYKEEVSDVYDAQFKKEVEEPYKNSTSAEEYNRIVEEWKADHKKQSFEDFLQEESNAYLNVDALSDDERKALENVLGKPLYQKLANKDELTQEQETYIRNSLSNARYGYKGITNAEQIAGIADVRNRIQQGTFSTYDETVADAYMSGFGNWQEYSALVREQETLRANGEELSPEKVKLLNQYTTALDKFERNAQIKLEIDGIKQLEQAGEVAEGTASAFEKLAQGGKTAAEALNELTVKGFESGQKRAKLYNGTARQQDEAAMAYLGMSADQYYADREGNLQAAKDYETILRASDARQWEELLAGAPTEEERQRIIDIAKRAGFEAHQDVVTEYGPNGLQHRYVDTRFSYAGAGNVTNVNPLIGKEQAYTDYELAQARQAILNGTLTDETDLELYNAAVQSGGHYFQEYERRLANGDIEGANKIKVQARQETALAGREARQADQLEQARLASGTLGGMFAYAQEQQTQSNKAKLAADQIFGTLDPSKIKSFTDLANSVNGDQAKNWRDLLESTPELAQKLTDLGATVGPDGIDFSDVESSGHSLADALSMLTASVAEASKSFGQYKEVLTTGETYDRAMQYLSGAEVVDEAKGFEALNQVYGNQTLAQVVANNRATGALAEGEWIDNRGLVRDANGDIVNKSYDKYATLSAYNREYAETLEQNAALGISGLTDVQRLDQLQTIMNAAQNGGLAALREDDKINQFGDVTSGIEGFGQWEAAVESIQAAGLSLKDYTKDSEAFKTAIEASGMSVGQFDSVNKQMTAEIRARSISAMKLYGENSDEVANFVRSLAKGGKDASQAIGQFNQKVAQLNNGALAIQKAAGKKGSQVDSKTRGDIAAITGDDADLMKNYTKEQMEEALNRAQDIIDDDYVNDLGAKITEKLNAAFSDKEITADLAFKFDVNADGELDLSEIEALARELGDEALAILASHAGTIGQLLVEIEKNGMSETAVAKVIKGSVNTGGTGKRMGGGGGGGGGKSPTDKLLEQQKHRISDINHQIKMTQIDEAHQDRMNNTSAYFDSLDREIGLQNRLGKEYQNNIAEMKAQLGSVKEGSDDWKKLTEAIWEAEEAYAAIQDTIEDVNAKRLAHLQKQQKNQDAKDDYTTSMWGIYAQRFLSEERYADYRQAIENQIGATRSAITTNNQQITELEGELGNFVEGSDEFMQIEQDIMNIKQDTAQKENEMVQLQIELDRQRLAQIATYLQRSSATGQHNINMLQTYGQAYSTAGFNDEYRKNMEDQLDDYDKLIAANREARDSAVATMNSFVTGSTVWYEARDAVYQYDEAIAQATTAQIELRRAMQELDLQMISDAYNDAIRGDEHVTKLMEDLRQSFLETKDYEAYNEATRRIINEKQELIDDAQKAAQAQRDYIANNELDIALRREAEETLNQYEETVSSLIAERDRMVRELQKNEIDQMIEKMDWRASEYEHNLKLIQYQETKYQNADELTNYGIMLRHETDLRQENADALEKEITALKAELVGLEENKEEYQKVVEQIRKKEEQLKSENTQILKNNELLEENTKKIVQVRKTLEDSIDKEIRAEKKRQRDMLNATVSMQNNIVDVIRKRYTSEFELEKRRIAQQKQALTEEKALIAQRLNARKKAADEAEKYEELAELRRQLALIQSDTTRTKDAKELREKIKNLEKDIAWGIADQEAAAEQEGLDNQIKALDDYVTVNEENLNEMLSDANNFVDEVGGLITGSYEQIVLWMQQNNTAYKNSLDEAQQQMINSWEDTWKAMHNITDTYWTEVGQLMVTRDTYLDYMRSTSQEYRDANESGKFLLEKQWEDMYDKYVSSTVTSDEAVNWQIHQHDLPEIISKIDKLDDIVYDIYGLIKDPYEFEKWRTYDFANRDNSTGEMPDFSVDYTGWGRTEDLSGTDSYEPSDYSGDGGGSGGGGGGSGKGKADHGFQVTYGSSVQAAKELESEKIAKEAANSIAEFMVTNDLKKRGLKPGTLAYNNAYQEAHSRVKIMTYLHGGLADYTGPAWVDGTKQRPEAFLDAYDTESIRQMLDAFNYIRQKPMMTAIDPAFFKSGTTNTMGDLNVSINVEKLDSDADYEYIADKVGEVFQKKLQKNGFNTAAYSF